MTPIADSPVQDACGPQLTVQFVGDERILVPGDEMTFGRSGDLIIDENRYLHRLVGKFMWSNGMWWLANLGSSIPLTVSDIGGPSFSRVSPGSSLALSFESCLVVFAAGGRNYELIVDVIDDGHDDAPNDGDEVGGDEIDGSSDEVTTTASSLPMSAEQRLLLVALAECQLRDPGSANEMPTNRQIAARLGWTITKYNRKLDGLCTKFAAAGVAGLRGSSDALARDRRLHLVDHALYAGTVTAADLEMLP